MSKGRLEAFSDGVFAIIITIMVLELSVPNRGNWSAIFNVEWLSTFFAYFVSFVLTASFWISHHRIVDNLKTVDTGVLWANFVALFPISLLPSATAWFGRFPNMTAPSATYAGVYTFSVVGLYYFSAIVARHVPNVKVQYRMRHVNRGRLWLMVVGIVGVLVATIAPLLAGGFVFIILISWMFWSVLHPNFENM